MEADDLHHYEDLEEVYSTCRSNEITIIMGDWNAKVGSEREGKIVGPHGLGERNDRGDKLVDWCRDKDMIITNTWFQVDPRRRYTWTSPDEKKPDRFYPHQQQV
ncbi:craniofacial development protein 2-like [Penaeus japonicus]|uniref:craniofacial development protein 2-like n=1 Tax=Penaeus japonicus TaxID=27405 RepID=UPI001C70BFF4|nr:craniofacial development protein 2-like [Penaeus japonicus]